MSGQATAALTGAGLAALVSGVRYLDETDRRLRHQRNNIQDLESEIQTLLGRGDMIRLRLPVVQDAQVGLAMANPTNPAPVTVPGGLPITQRPELAQVAQTAVKDLQWPPKPGTYTPAGSVEQVGELTVSALADTFEENRAIKLGVVQQQSPTSDHKVQIFYAFNALIAQLGHQSLTWAQYKAAWERLFGIAGSPVGDPHFDPGRPPTVVPGSLGVNVTSVVPLTATSIPGYPFKNLNTDSAMRFRVTTGGNVIAGTQLCSIRFGTEYRYQAQDGSINSFQPFVNPSPGAYGIYTLGATSQTFELYNTTIIPAGTVDVFVSTTAGIAVVG
jgi:hypothetical protein